MCSFQTLPPELKQRICLFCHHADEAHRTRIQGQGFDSDRIKTKTSHGWGKSLVSLSAVNKELRSYCLKHLFSTLRISKVEQSTFQEDILNSPLLCSNFTTIDFEFDPDTNLQVILFALLHVVPRLPKLNRVIGLDRDVLEVTFGQGGIINAARNFATPVSISSENYISAYRKQAWNGFKSLIKRLKHLEVELDGEEFETLLSIDDSIEIRNNLETLSLFTPEEDGFSILEDPTSKFPALLSTLPNLKSLTIHKTLIITESPGERFLSPLSKPALSTPYSFCSTLTSFTHFSTPSSLCSKIDLDFLKFLTRFPILRHLKIAANNCDGIDPKESQNPILLPNVIDLELVGYDKIYVGIDSVLDYLKLPKLSNLTLEYDHLNVDFYHTLEGIEVFEKLKKRILDLDSPFLKNVYLLGNSFQGIYKSILDIFQQEKEKEKDSLIQFIQIFNLVYQKLSKVLSSQTRE